MKKRKLFQLLLILLCLAVYFGYRAADRLRTDTKAPEITISADTLEVSAQEPRTALLQGITAKDNADGDVTASLVVERIQLADQDGTVNVRYAAFDRSGNVAKADRQVRYTDYERPKFQLDAPLIYTQNSSFDVLNDIDAVDTLDGDISHRIRATSMDDASISSAGSHEVEFRVTNSLGDTVKIVLPVEVYAAGTYQAQLSLTNYLIYLEQGARFNANDYLNDFTLNRETTSLREGIPEHYNLRTTGTVDTQTPGVYEVSYRVSYTVVNEFRPEDSQIYVGYSKLIVVVEG